MTAECHIAKGNVVADKFDRHALVLALTKDAKRAKLHRFGHDSEPVWQPVSWFTLVESGSCECWKCGGSGLFYFGGMVLNGVYQGKTGPCFACEGKGNQTDEDRIRCHYYWHRYGKDVMPADFNELVEAHANR